MKLKRILSLCLAALFVLTFSGCDALELNIDELLASPKLEGDMYPVQQALEASVKGNITLKYPVSGEYRSAFVLKDVDADGTDEAFAFYSATADSTVSMHINVIKKEDNEWSSKGDLSLVGNGIESVSFADLDGNGSLEIIVGWMVYGTAEKQLGIYTFDGEFLTQRAIENYTNFTYADLTGDTVSDLLIVYLNTSEMTSAAKLFSLSDLGITEVGAVALDGGVSSYSSPVVSKLSDGTGAVYIDAVKGSGMLTEIIWYKDGALRGIYAAAAPESSLTYRSGTVASRDYDGNGVIDIPLSELLLSTQNMADSDKAYYTNWSEFDGAKLTVKSSAFMNYSDGYTLTVPSKWKQKLLLIRKMESRTRFFYSYDPVEDYSSDELFRIVTVSSTEYDSEFYLKNDYFLLDETETLVYLARVSPNNSFEMTENDVKSMFNLIK